jgi:hypothetical protein
VAMSDDEIRRALQQLCAAPVINKVATVVSVDLENYTATVLPEGEAELDEVRLKAGIDGEVDGIVEVPKVDSDVLISLIGNDLDNAYIAKCSKVEKIIMFGGELGGLIKIEYLLQRINALETKMNTHTHPVTVVPATGIGTAAFTTSQIAPLTLRTDLEDTKVLH